MFFSLKAENSLPTENINNIIAIIQIIKSMILLEKTIGFNSAKNE